MKPHPSSPCSSPRQRLRKGSGGPPSPRRLVVAMVSAALRWNGVLLIVPMIYEVATVGLLGLWDLELCVSVWPSSEGPRRESFIEVLRVPKLHRAELEAACEHLHGDNKNSHLKKLENASENLQLFKADLLDYDSMLAAAAGCEGVFHVASPVPTTKVSNPEVELISPAVTGTQNVLKACSTLRIKRLVVVSSVADVILNPHWPKGKVMDEECWSDPEHCRMTENWYYLAKTLAEADALKYAKENDLDVVTVCPSMVLGPIMQPTLNTSTLFLIKILKGLRESKENSLYHTVDVRDVADALLLVYEKPEASGRYICSSHPIKIRELIDILRSIYPNYNYLNNLTEVDYGHLISSEKLKKLGWKCRPLKETLVNSVESYKEAGLLDN